MDGIDGNRAEVIELGNITAQKFGSLVTDWPELKNVLSPSGSLGEYKF